MPHTRLLSTTLAPARPRGRRTYGGPETRHTRSDSSKANLLSNDLATLDQLLHGEVTSSEVTLATLAVVRAKSRGTFRGPETRHTRSAAKRDQWAAAALSPLLLGCTSAASGDTGRSPIVATLDESTARRVHAAQCHSRPTRSPCFVTFCESGEFAAVDDRSPADASAATLMGTRHTRKFGRFQFT